MLVNEEREREKVLSFFGRLKKIEREREKEKPFQSSQGQHIKDKIQWIKYQCWANPTQPISLILIIFQFCLR